MNQNEKEQKKYIEKVDNFIKEAEQIGNNIVSLANSIEIFSNKINDLKQIKELDDSLNNLSSNISYLESCNQKLKNVFIDVERFVNLEDDIQKSREIFKTIEDKLKNILSSIEKIDDNSSNINLEYISNELNSVSTKITALNNTIHNNIIVVIQENLTNNLETINKELVNLQNSFLEYKEANEKMVNELKKENEDIKKYFNELLSTNKDLIEMLKDIQKTNDSAKKYLDLVIDNWYDENINFIGKKKKKKDKDENNK